MHWNFILESYLVTVFVPELQKIMLRKLARLNGNVQNTNVSISEPLLEIIKPSVIAVLRHRLLFPYGIRTCSSYPWVPLELGCKQWLLWAPHQAPRCDSPRALPGRAEHGWLCWLGAAAEHWQPSPLPWDYIPAGRWGHSASTLNLVWICQDLKDTNKKHFVLAALEDWHLNGSLHCLFSGVGALLCSEHIVVWQSLLWAVHSFPEHLRAAASHEPLVWAAPRSASADFHGNWWPLSTVSLCQGSVLPSSPPGCWSSCPSLQWEHTVTAGTFSSLLKKLQRISGDVVVSPENHLCLFVLYCCGNLTEYSGNIAICGLVIFGGFFYFIL